MSSKLDNLELIAKKKKNKVIVFFVVAIFGFLFISFIHFLLNVDNSKIFEKRKIDKLEGLEVIKNPEFKENWAISVGNRMKKQEERTREVVDLLKNNQDSTLTELKSIINENNQNVNAQISLIKDSAESRYEDIKNMIDSKMKEQDKRIDQLKQIAEERYNDRSVDNESDSDIIIGGDYPVMKDSNATTILNQLDSNLTKNDSNKSVSVIEAIKRNPNLSEEDKLNFTKTIENSNNSPIEKKKNDNKINKPRKKKLVVVDIDTSFNKKLIKENNKITMANSNEEELAFKLYHISTGFTKAYMVTGAYAPAFQEGSMEPLPVLFETEGDIIMSNNVTGNIEKCFMLGSAKGNMNSQTADIKLVSISCLINGGKARIEGSISGWVIGENGTPGLQGEMIHKNGALIARTFVSGFFETFSQALSGGQTDAINLGTDTTDTTTTTQSTSNSVNNNLLYAGASGISNVFSKLGDYYIKMAEQIFPIIEVKGGRTVSILLIGGEDLQVVSNNKVSMADMNDMSEKIELEKINKKGIIKESNAFFNVTSSNDDPTIKDRLGLSSDNEDSDVEDMPELIKEK